VDEVRVDGVPLAPYAFREEGRRALLLALTLPARTQVTVTIDLNESASDLPTQVPVQPVALPSDVTVIDAPCRLTDS